MKKPSKLLSSFMLALILSAAWILVPGADPAFAEGSGQGDGEAAVVESMSQTAVGGVTYFYTDTAGDPDDTIYRATVRSRAGSTDYDFAKADLTMVTDSDYAYVTAPNVTALSGTLYGYGQGTVTSYKDIYAALGVATDDSFDAVSSATNYTSRHAGDIPSNAVFGKDAAGNKAITGVNLNREAKTVAAVQYVEASILQAAGETLTEGQQAALALALKANPMTAPAEQTIHAKFGRAEYVASKYGAGEINIYPDDTVEGYTWNEYLDSIYAATISDGTNTAGSVYWIDLYGEKAVSGYHYNKVEFELNSGRTKADNEAEVHRFDQFLDKNTGCLKPGAYTVRVYAEGYDVVEGTIEIAAEGMSQTSIGGTAYYYADTAGDQDTVYQATARSRAGSTDYYFFKDQMTQLGETDIYYTTLPNAVPLSGTLYGYGQGTVTSYKDIYAALGVATDDSFDAVSSATNYTSHHAGDIPSNVIFGTDANGNKAITGVNLNREAKTVDAVQYVEASILQAAGKELSDDQQSALALTLKANPMKAPAEQTIHAKAGKIEYVNSKYGTGEINVYPDDTVEGYTWNEYLDSIYAATISDGTNTAGSVYWIDLYGEKATSGYHYNKVEFELNNGLTKADNEAVVGRFASFFDESTGSLKPGTYTVKVYAEGYDTVTDEITIPDFSDAAVTLDQTAYTYNGQAATPAVTVTMEDQTLEEDTDYTVTYENNVDAGTATVTVTPTRTYTGTSSAAFTINKAAQKLSVKTVKKTFKAKKLKKKAQTISLAKAVKVTGAQGKVTYTVKPANAKAKKALKCTSKKITVKKKTKKGTYKVKVTVKASATGNYLAAKAVTKTVTIKVK